MDCQTAKMVSLQSLEGKVCSNIFPLCSPLLLRGAIFLFPLTSFLLYPFIYPWSLPFRRLVAQSFTSAFFFCLRMTFFFVAFSFFFLQRWPWGFFFPVCHGWQLLGFWTENWKGNFFSPRETVFPLLSLSCSASFPSFHFSHVLSLSLGLFLWCWTRMCR